MNVLDLPNFSRGVAGRDVEELRGLERTCVGAHEEHSITHRKDDAAIGEKAKLGGNVSIAVVKSCGHSVNDKARWQSK